MRSEQNKADMLMDAMNFIDDELIASAEEARSGKYKKKSVRVTIIRFMPYAVAAALLAGVGLSVLHLHRNGRENGASSVANVQASLPGIDVAYVDVNELLAENPAEEATQGGIIRDFEEEEDAQVIKAGEGQEVLATLPYDGKKVEVILLTLDGEESLYERAVTSSEGQEKLPASTGEGIEGADGWYKLSGHDDTDYLIYEDAAGNWSLWQKRY